MPGYFVTATGTDIGKTYVTAGLIRAARRAGQDVGALKPIVSGLDPLSPESSDPYALMEALDIPVSELDRIAPWRFAPPLSPDMAAAREDRTIDLTDVEGFCREALLADRLTFIEGVGGVMVPLNTDKTVLDWMTALRLPLVLVAGSYLGTISHTLSAMDVVLRRDLKITCVIVNESETRNGAPLQETADTIARFAPSIRVATLPRNASDADFDAILSVITDAAL